METIFLENDSTEVLQPISYVKSLPERKGLSAENAEIVGGQRNV